MGEQLNELERHIVQLAKRNLCRDEILSIAGEGMFTRKEVQAAFTKLKKDGTIYQVDDYDRFGRRMWGA